MYAWIYVIVITITITISTNFTNGYFFVCTKFMCIREHCPDLENNPVWTPIAETWMD